MLSQCQSEPVRGSVRLNLLRKGFCFLLLQKVIADIYSLLSKRVAVLLPTVLKLSQGIIMYANLCFYHYLS